MRIALVGQPNCGKSVLFNSVAGYKTAVSNFPGTTIEYVCSDVCIGVENFELVDLPGIYSLSSPEKHELLARDYLLNKRPDAIINIIDASVLSRSLELTIELLDLRIPIWDGGVTAARVAQAYADVNRSREQLEQTRLGTGLEARTAALTLQQAIERVSTTAENVVLAEEALRLATVRYNAGIATLVEVTDAESALTQARFNAVDSRYDYAVALADLQDDPARDA